MPLGPVFEPRGTTFMLAFILLFAQARRTTVMLASTTFILLLSLLLNTTFMLTGIKVVSLCQKNRFFCFLMLTPFYKFVVRTLTRTKNAVFDEQDDLESSNILILNTALKSVIK